MDISKGDKAMFTIYTVTTKKHLKDYAKEFEELGYKVTDEGQTHINLKRDDKEVTIKVKR